MRKLLMVVVGAALAASSAFAGVLPTVKAMVDRLGPRADTVLARSGISDPVAVAAVLSADETQVVNTLANSTKVGDVVTAIALSLLCDEWSPAGLASVEGFVRKSENKSLANRLDQMCSAPATSNLWRPLEARKALRPLIAAVYSVLYPTRPGWCAYNVTKAITGAVGIEDNVALLLAPEEGEGGTVVGSKKAIFDAAVVQAKVKLRSEGKTFIVGPDGVNPLTAVLQPVVTALNAPLLNGLEQALAGLGLSVEQIKMSRDPLKQLADGWCKKIMNAGADRTDIKWRRPKISVALGAEDYAAFIRRYNEGN